MAIEDESVENLKKDPKFAKEFEVIFGKSLEEVNCGWVIALWDSRTPDDNKHLFVDQDSMAFLQELAFELTYSKYTIAVCMKTPLPIEKFIDSIEMFNDETGVAMELMTVNSLESPWRCRPRRAVRCLPCGLVTQRLLKLLGFIDFLDGTFGKKDRAGC